MLLASIIGGVGIVVNQVEDNGEKKGAAHLWQIGFLLILMSNLDSHATSTDRVCFCGFQ